MKFLKRLAINRGLLGGNPFFTAIAIAFGVSRVLQKVTGTGPRTLYTHKLKGGETLVVSHPTSR